MEMVKCFRFDHIWIHQSWQSYLFLSKTISKFFSLPSPRKSCALPFDFALESDPKNIFCYQYEIGQTRSSIFYYLIDMNIYTRNLPACNSGQYIHVTGVLFLCFSRFDWQNQFLFSENSFSEKLASCWL